MDTIIENYRSFASLNSNLLESNPDYQKLCISTSFLDEFYQEIPTNQRFYHYKNNLFEIVKCQNCGNPSEWAWKLEGERGHSRYNKFCCEKCRLDYIEKQKEITAEKNKKMTEINRELQRPIGEQKREQQKENTKLKNSEKFQLKYGEFLSKNNVSFVSNEVDRKYVLKCNCCNNIIETTISTVNNQMKNDVKMCQVCNPRNYSGAEKEMIDYVRSLLSEDDFILENTKQIIKPYELDCYLPEYNLAFEFNGDYWHANPIRFKADDIISIHGRYKAKVSEIWEKDKKKENICKKKKINLIVIWEHDWINDKENTKNKIKNILLSTKKMKKSDLYLKNQETYTRLQKKRQSDKIIDKLHLEILEMTRLEKIQYIKDLSKSQNTHYVKILKETELLEILLEMTSFLEEFYQDITINQRFWHIKNNSLEIVVCNKCKDKIPLRWLSNRKYSRCCDECASKTSIKNMKK